MDNSISISDLYKLLQQLVEQSAEIKKDIEAINNKLTRNENFIDNLKEKINKLEGENQKLKSKTNELDKKNRRNNIIIFGIEEKGGEDLIEKVVSLINTKLNLNTSIADVSNGYRIGKKNENISRPIILELLRVKQKQLILNNTYKLKGDNTIAISSDMTKEEREEGKILRKHLRLAKAKNLNAKITGNKLIINGQFFTTQQLESQNLVEEIKASEKNDKLSELTSQIVTRQLARKNNHLGAK